MTDDQKQHHDGVVASTETHMSDTAKLVEAVKDAPQHIKELVAKVHTNAKSINNQVKAMPGTTPAPEPNHPLTAEAEVGGEGDEEGKKKSKK